MFAFKANVRLIEQLSRRLSPQTPEKSTTWEFDLPLELLFLRRTQNPKFLNNGWERKC